MNFNDWFELNSLMLEASFLDEWPVDEQPLDDDIPNFLHDHAEELEEYARGQYNELKGLFRK